MKASSRAIAAFELGIVLGCLATFTVILRFQARHKTRTALGADDYSILIGLAFMIAFLASSGILVFNAGLGNHEADLSPSENYLFGIFEFVSELLYLFTMASAKISILLLYRRIFATRSFRIITNLMGFVILAWCISSALVTSFACDPAEAVWNFNITTATCLDPVIFSLAIAITGVLTDLIILFLPLNMIWKLRLPTRQKFVLSAVFLLGGFVCVASVMRIISLQGLNIKDLPYTLLVSATWTLTEAELALTTANLPLLRPVLPSRTKLVWLQSYIRNSLMKSGDSDQSDTRNISNNRQEMDAIITVEGSRNVDSTWFNDSSSPSLGRPSSVA